MCARVTRASEVKKTWLLQFSVNAIHRGEPRSVGYYHTNASVRSPLLQPAVFLPKRCRFTISEVASPCVRHLQIVSTKDELLVRDIQLCTRAKYIAVL